MMGMQRSWATARFVMFLDFNCEIP